MNGLQFFLHDDPDAVRIELAGKLRGADAETVYRTWTRAALPNILKHVIVDVTFVTDADEYGRALLVVMHRFGARIIAQSPQSSAIVQPIVSETVEISPSKPGWLRRFISFLREDESAGAAFPAEAGIRDLVSAGRRQSSIESAVFGDPGLVEDVVHNR
jgi:hypothetical protein